MFLWSVLRALNPTKSHPERVDKELKLKENTLNMEGIEYPVSLKAKPKHIHHSIRIQKRRRCLSS